MTGGDRSRSLRRVVRFLEPRLGVAIALLAGAVVFWVAVDLFPYHSVNHDEAVYLQQADLLLEGRLGVSPAVPEAVRPWFFLSDGGYLYPKYAPVPAAVFALGELLGGYRLSLAAVAAANVGLTVALATSAFDRRTGLLAGTLLLATPAFLLTSAVFLPYAPTTALNLLFALAYVRSARSSGRRSLGYATLAGVAVGLAFFARPYTAVLFAVPFVVHAVWSLWRATRDRGALVSLLARQGVVAVLGAGGVALALAYNARMTGDPLLFPFEAFAPKDGLGFGRHRILDHAVDYTPALALRANARLLWEFATRWTVAAPIGTLLFGIGAGRFLRSRAGSSSSDGGSPASHPVTGLPARTLGWLLLGVLASVVVGNVYFWGNYNVLATLSDPTDGFIAGFGPLYHFDALPVLATFGAVGALAVWDRIHEVVQGRLGSDGYRRLVLAAVLVVGLGAGVVAETAALDDPVEGHAAYTDRYAETYAPLEAHDFEDAVVFVPAAYGGWLNHPFQSLRNDPGSSGLEGPVVYALDRTTAEDFAVLDAYQQRRPYRFNYRGEWTPDPADRVTPKLRALRVREAAALTVRTAVSVPPNVESGYVRLSVDGDSASETLAAPAGNVTVRWRLTPDGARIVGLRANGTGIASGPTGDASDLVALDGPDEVALAITFVTPDGATVTYRQELDVRPHEGGVQAVWPPESSVCRLVTDCGLEGTYLPAHPGKHLEGVWMNATVASSE